MIHYKDITFCKAYKTCAKGNDCEMALTPEVIKDANEWWGSKGAPICMTDKRGCYVELVKE